MAAARFVRERRHPGAELGVVVIGDFGEHREPGGRRQRIAREGAGLVHRPLRGQRSEQLPAAAQGTDGQPAADDLAETPKIGGDAGPGGGAAGSDPEPRDDLVEDQQRPGGIACTAQGSQEPGAGWHEVHVGRHRLDNDAGHLGVQFRHHVVGRHDRVRHGSLRHADRSRKPEHGHPAAAAGQEPVGVAVITAVELHHAVPTRDPASQAHGAHGRLRPRRDEPHLLATGHPLADRLGQEHLSRSGRPECGPQRGCFRKGCRDDGVRMTEEHGPVGLDHVDVAGALGVDHVGTLALHDRVRSAAHRSEGTYRRVDATRDDPLGPGEPVGVGQARGGGRGRFSHRAARPRRRRSR